MGSLLLSLSSSFLPLLFFQVDCLSLRLVAALSRLALPDFDLTWLARALEKRLRAELDFRIEADNACRVRSVVQREDALQKHVYVPEVWAMGNRNRNRNRNRNHHNHPRRFPRSTATCPPPGS